MNPLSTSGPSSLLRVLALAGLLACASTPEPQVEPAPKAASAARAAPAPAPELTEVPSFGTNPGALRMWEHAPPSLSASAPLVVVLHGCTQTAHDASKVGWNTLADELGFAVVYPEQRVENNPLRCFNWTGVYGDPGNVIRGKAENQSIKEMVDKAVAARHLDSKRVFVVGFSAGGAMAALLAATWPDVFGAAATFAGIPYRCATQTPDIAGCMKTGKDMPPAEWGKRVRDAFPGSAGKYPRMSIWHGTTDTVVAPSNARQLIRQWTNAHGLPATPSTTDTVDGHRHTVYNDAQANALVESYEIEGLGHAFPVVAAGGTCGAADTYSSDKGICAVRHVARFFGITAGRK